MPAGSAAEARTQYTPAGSTGRNSRRPRGTTIPVITSRATWPRTRTKMAPEFELVTEKALISAALSRSRMRRALNWVSSAVFCAASRSALSSCAGCGADFSAFASKMRNFTPFSAPCCPRSCARAAPQSRGPGAGLRPSKPENRTPKRRRLPGVMGARMPARAVVNWAEKRRIKSQFSRDIIDKVDLGDDADKLVVVDHDHDFILLEELTDDLDAIGRLDDGKARLDQRVDDLVARAVAQKMVEHVGLVDDADDAPGVQNRKLADIVGLHQLHDLADPIADAGGINVRARAARLGRLRLLGQQIADGVAIGIFLQEAVLAHPVVVEDLGEIARGRVGHDDHDIHLAVHALGVFDGASDRAAGRAAGEDALFAH